MSFALETLARSSLAQFMTIYSEVVTEFGNVDAATLERYMWTKITGGSTKAASKIPWALVKKIKIQLPYLPQIVNYTGCQGLKKCDGLYVPCGGKCTEESILCITCEKHGAKFGVLEDRGDAGNYTDPEDKREITYGTWLQKHDKTIEDVNSAIQEAGFTFEIPTSYLAVNTKRVVKHKAGRPKSKLEVSEDDSDSELSQSSAESKPKAVKKKASAEESEKPKKTKAKKAETSDDEEPKAEKPKKTKAKKAETSDDEEPKVEKPKKTKAKKAETSDAEEPKAEKPKKTKAKKAEEPKVEKEPQFLEGIEDLKSLTQDVFEQEDETVVFNSTEYTLRGKTIFDEDGMFVGTMVDGAPQWREE